MRNRRPFLKLLLLALALALAGLLQGTEAVRLWGLKPNLVLALLVAASFFVARLPEYLVLVAVGLSALRFSNLFSPELLAVAASSLLAFLAGARLPGKPWVNNLALIAAGQLLFYALAARGFFGAPLTMLQEFVYNGVVGAAAFLILRRLFPAEHEAKFRD